jgi:hypothetical protein
VKKTEIQRMLETAVSMEVGIVLARDDFYAALQAPVPDPTKFDKTVAWKIEPKEGWTVSADNEGNLTTVGTPSYKPPVGWHWVGTIALISNEKPSADQRRRVDVQALCFSIEPDPNIRSFVIRCCNKVCDAAMIRMRVN